MHSDPHAPGQVHSHSGSLNWRWGVGIFGFVLLYLAVYLLLNPPLNSAEGLLLGTWTSGSDKTITYYSDRTWEKPEYNGRVISRGTWKVEGDEYVTHAHAMPFHSWQWKLATAFNWDQKFPVVYRSQVIELTDSKFVLKRRTNGINTTFSRVVAKEKDTGSLER